MIKYLLILLSLTAISGYPQSYFLPFLKGAQQEYDFSLNNKTASGIALAISNNFYQNITENVIIYILYINNKFLWFFKKFLHDLSQISKNLSIPNVDIQQSIFFIDFIFKAYNLNISQINFDSSLFKITFEKDNSTNVHM